MAKSQRRTDRHPKTRGLTSKDAFSHPVLFASLSSGMRGRRRSPKLLAAPMRSRSFIRKMYEASCFEYARTKDTKPFTAYDMSLNLTERIAGNRTKYLVVQSAVCQDGVSYLR
jgi:hypothetical protein